MPEQESPFKDRLVLVVGAPRSGTTWVQRAIAAHPDVLAIASETHLFSSAISVLRDQAQGGVVGSPATGTWFMPEQDFNRAARAFCDAALAGYVSRTQPDALRVIERSPTHVWHLGLIARLYPDAWVVHVVRDGRDVVRSQVSQVWGPGDISTAAAMWASAIRSARAAAPDLTRYLEVRYEDLLAQPRAITEVFAFLGVPPLEEAVRRSELESGRAVNVDPTRPDVAAGKWRSEWNPLDVAAFESAAGDVLVEAGYTSEPATAPASRHRRLPTRWRRTRRKPVAVPTVLGHEDAQRFVDRMLEELALGDTATLRSALAPDAVVRFQHGDDRWATLGPDGSDQLQSVLDREGAWGAAERGEQHIAGRSWTLLLAHRAGAGELVERLVQLTLTPELLVSELRLTRFGA
ncbi:MAG: sulfotransferase family protein [Frankiales bacterium]|nr:sulfotransferase family protein [Frankiales bacterium]